MDRWVGRVAIVTGASSGIGAAIAKLLAEQGMKVVGAARREQRVKDLKEKLGKIKGELHAVQCDVTKDDDVSRVVKYARTLGGADVLVNNAGIFCMTPLTGGSTTASIEATLNTNVLGLCIFTREVIKCMTERGVTDGHIFHISSVTGQRIIDFSGGYVYFASKHAVRVLTEGLRRELRDLKSKTKITSISPGLVRTEVMTANGGLPEELALQMQEHSPILEPEDVAGALFYSLTTPKHVQVHEITIQPVGEKN